MTRREEALDFLVSRVAEAEPVRAVEALAALAIHRHDERLRERVSSAVAERGESRLHALFEREF